MLARPDGRGRAARAATLAVCAVVCACRPGLQTSGDELGPGGVRRAALGSDLLPGDVFPVLAPCAVLPQGPFDGCVDVPGWTNRCVSLHVPAAYRCDVATPVVLAFHGGGANSERFARQTCRNGDLGDASCLNSVADREGFVVAWANGTGPGYAPDTRTFAAGGTSRDDDHWECVSGHACNNHIDDVGYAVDLLELLPGHVNVDPARVFALGMSNGGAMSHAIACRLSDRIAAITAVAGGNQLTAAQPCLIERPVPVLQIHGDSDPCWPFLPVPGTCPGATSYMFHASATVDGWVRRNHCSVAPVVEDLADVDPTDNTTVRRHTWGGCDQGADVVLYEIVGGGHGWPGGSAPLGEVWGELSQEINSSEVAWAFFASHPRP